MKSILTLACMAASFAVVAADSAKLKDWKTRVPRPIYDEKPELVELYDRTWEIAHARIDNLPPTEPKPATYGKKPGYSRPDFCGWSALGPISLFVEDILGIKEANAFTNTLVCDFPPTVKGRVGVENYRFGTVICSIIVERRDVRIVSNAPFELVANGERRTVMKGSQIFQLNDSLGGARYE